MGRKIVNFLEDEEVSNCVKNFPCLYDKADSFYKDKRAKKNAWKRIEEDLGLEEGTRFFFYNNTKIGDSLPIFTYYSLKPFLKCS